MGYLRDKAPLPGGTESRTGHSHSVAPLVNHLSVAVCLCVCVCVCVCVCMYLPPPPLLFLPLPREIPYFSILSPCATPSSSSFLTTRLTRIIFTSLTSFSEYDGQCCYFTTSLLSPPPTPSFFPTFPGRSSTPLHPPFSTQALLGKYREGWEPLKQEAKTESRKEGKTEKGSTGREVGPGQGGGDQGKRERRLGIWGGGGRGGRRGAPLFVRWMKARSIKGGHWIRVKGRKLKLWEKKGSGKGLLQCQKCRTGGEQGCYYLTGGPTWTSSPSLSLLLSSPSPCWLHRDEGEAWQQARQENTPSCTYLTIQDRCAYSLLNMCRCHDYNL